MLTHRNLESNGRMGEGWINPGDDEVIYSVLPLFHAYGMTLGVTIASLCRARLVLFPDRGHGPDFEGGEEDPPDHSSCGSAGIAASWMRRRSMVCPWRVSVMRSPVR